MSSNVHNPLPLHKGARSPTGDSAQRRIRRNVRPALPDTAVRKGAVEDPRETPSGKQLPDVADRE